MKRQLDTLSHINLLVTHPYGRGGSLFVHSLFDSHPAVLTLPRCGALYSWLPETVGAAELEQKINALIAHCPGIFDSSKEYFGNMSGITTGRFGMHGEQNLIVDPAQFKRRLLALCNQAGQQLSRKMFFILLHVAYGHCLGRHEMSQVKYIFYHPHARQEIDVVASDFPDLYLIAMTRDPRQNWTSWKKIHGLRMGRDWSTVPPISLFLEAKIYADSCHHLYRLFDKLRQDHIRIVDLESFHVMNRRAMAHLCAWLGIEFDQILMESTFNGVCWYGNATNMQQTSSFNAGIKRDAWRDELSASEIDAINNILPGTIRYLHYDIAPGQQHGQQRNLFEVLHQCVKYDNPLLLAMHCILHISGNPLVVYPGIEYNYSRIKRARGWVRKFITVTQTIPYSLGLARQLHGGQLRALLGAMAANEEKLLGDAPPPQAFIGYYNEAPDYASSAVHVQTPTSS